MTMFLRKKAALLLIFCTAVVLLFAQTADVTQGCVPLNVAFTAPAGYSTFYWDFKDGASSVQQNPSNLFITPGTYTVEFRETQNGTVRGTITINVYPKPVPTVLTDSLPNKGCTPYNVNFRVNANAPSGVTISNYNWTFGDGFAGNGANVSHTYTQAGYYSVGVELTSPTPSCNVTLLLDSFVYATGFKGIASATPLLSCTAPHTVTFANTLESTTAAGITYSWNFGDGSTSNVKIPPAKTYSDTGVYQIKFTATDAAGCKWILDTVLRIRNFDADFTMKDTVCAGSKLFLFGKNVAGASYFWNLTGADTTGSLNAQNTFAVYNTVGTYPVVFFTVGGGCIKTKNKSIVVIIPEVRIEVKPDTICDKFFTVKLSVIDSSIVDSVQWYFTYNDTIIVSRKNFSNLTTTIPFDTITWEANDTACVRVFTKYGCMLEYCEPFFYPAIAHVAPSKTEGCAPLSVSFENKSYSPYPLTYWVIEYGDGTKDSLAGNVKFTNHTYTVPGDYPVRIRIKNQHGCEDTSYVTYIHAGKKPNPNFSISKTNVCPGEDITLTDLTPASDSVEQWHYWADGLTVAHCLEEKDVTFSFQHQAGLQFITLEVYSDNCKADTSLPIFVNGPVANFRYKQYCDSAYVADFIDLSQIATRVEYHFGDGTSSTDRNPRHRYTADGIYTVTFIAFNDTNSCPIDTHKMEIIVSKPVAKFYMPASICAAPVIKLDASTTTGIIGTGCLRAYRWLLSPLEYDQRTEKNYYELYDLDSGSHTFGVVVENAIGCKDTAYTTFRVDKIMNNVQVSDTSICIPQQVTFDANVSSKFPFVAMNWDLGDGTVIQNIDSLTHNYTTTADTFVTVFYVRDSIGCEFRDTTLILVNKINALISISKTSICEGDTVTIATANNNNLHFLWDYGNGITDTVTSRQVVYKDTMGALIVRLTYTDKNNQACSRTAQSAVFVNAAPEISISSSVDSSQTFCFPLNINLKYIDSNATGISSVKWTLNNASNYFIDSIALTLGRGLNTIDLVTTNIYGCTDSASRTFNVIGPVGDFDIDTNNICVNEAIRFTLKDTNEVASYLWDFGDGITQADISPVLHYYTFVPTGGSTKAKLSVYGQGKTCPYSTEKTINIKDVFADFLRNNGDTAVCFGEIYLLENKSQNADSYFWDFGNGTTSNVKEPGTISYPTPGTYNVSLFIQNNQFGCKDTVTKEVIFHPVPEADAVGDTVCYGDSATVFAVNPVTGIFYVWQPSEILVPDTAAVSKGLFDETTLVTLNAINEFGCAQKDSVLVYVIPPPNDVIFDTIVPLGSTVTLPFELQFGYEYTWLPDTGLSCYGCSYPQVKTVVEKQFYTVNYRDTILFCFTGTSTYTIDVFPETFIKVPNTFTPNGDGKNDKVFAEGWGIKDLLYFRIYNRWGELVFETKDIKVGWDGTYKNIIQNDDVFLFKAEGLDFFDRPLKQEGYIHLMH